jgi:prolyl 4-hydroxylase
LASLPPADEIPEREELRRIGRKVRRRLAANKAVHRLPVDKAELWAVPRFLDAVECGRLITMIDAVARPSQAYDVDYSTGYRTSYSGDVDMRDPFIRVLEQRLTDLLGLRADHGEAIQGQRYLAGQEFKPHVDWYHPTTPIWDVEKEHGGQRAFTAMAFLNKVEEGGETDFPLLGIAAEPRPGTLLIWNNADERGIPNEATLHAGNRVSRGTKYIFTKWYRTGRWSPLAPPPPR